MSNGLEQISLWVSEYLPGALAALAILVVGWLVALVLASVVRKVVRRTGVESTLGTWLKDEDQAKPIEAARYAGRVTYYLVMFFVVVALFQSLGLTFIADPLRGFLSGLFEYAPRLVGAGVLVVVAWLAATVLKTVLSKALTAAKIDERLGDQTELDENRRSSLVQTLANAVYWLVFLLFLPAVLSALALEGLLVPVQDMLVLMLGFLPNILAASLIVLVGWIGARILQRLVSQLVAALGVDRVGASAGVSTILGAQKLSGLIGILTYALVFVFAIIAALNALALEAITTPASNMIGIMLEALPSILAAVLVLSVAYLVGKILAGLVTNIFTAAGFNNILKRLGFTQVSLEGKRSPSQVAGYLVLVTIMFFAAIEAAELLGFAILADLIARFVVVLAQVAVGLVIFGIGLYLAGVAHEVVLASGGPQANILARLAKVSTLILAGAMALSQMGVAQEIIIIGFGILVGAIALTAVIAFGVGGRDIAARELEQWVNRQKTTE